MTGVLHHWFYHPTALVLLILLPALAAVALVARRRHRSALARLGSYSALACLATVRHKRRTLRTVCLGAGLGILILGIAGPQWGRDREQASAPGRDLVLVLDMSRSMLAQDVLGQSTPNRLGAARDALAELVSAVQERRSHRVAVVIFAVRARVVCPLTYDYDQVRTTLAQVDPADPLIRATDDASAPVSGTRIGTGLALAVQIQDPQARGRQDILLISDGDDPADDDEWRVGIMAAQGDRIPVDVAGIGDPEKGSPIPLDNGGFLRYQGRKVLTRLHEHPLQEIAAQTGGVYIPARTKQLPLGEVFHQAMASGATRTEMVDVLPRYRPRYPWFLAAALVFLSLEMLLGDGRRTSASETPPAPARSDELAAPTAVVGFRAEWLVVITLALGSPGSGGNADELVRRGNAAFARQDYRAALTLYEQAETDTTDPGLVAMNEAAALYRLGDYAGAEQHYLRCLDQAAGRRLPCVLYDLGNCVVKQAKEGDAARLERAVGYYEECLNQKGAETELLQDARYNLDVARELRRKARTAKKPDSDGGSGASRSTNDGMKEEHHDTSNTSNSEQPSTANTRPADDHSTKPSEGATPTTQRPRPGAGNLPPIPDDDTLVPLSPEQTATYLQQAAQRILEERARLRVLGPPPPSGVMDW